MKKSFALLLVSCVLLAGCSKPDLKAVGKNLEQAKNYSTLITLNVKSTIDNQTNNYEKIKNVDIDNINGTAKVTSTVNFDKQKNKEVYYIKTEANNAITYKEKNGVVESKKETKDENSLYYITAYVNENSEIVQEEKLNKGYVFTIKLKQDRVNAFLNCYYDTTLINNGQYKVVDDALLKVTTSKSGVIETLFVDFKDVIKYENVKNKFEIFNLQIDFSNFNESNEVIIPNEIIESSIDSEILKIRQYVTDYVEEINSLSLDNGKTDNKLGYTIDTTDLTIVDNIVDNGVVTIGDYTVEIVDDKVGIPHK